MQNEPGNVVALIGNSGVGKSSLAQAGVIAALKRQEWPAGGAWPAALAESRSWLPLTIRPEDKPLKALALTFTRLLHERSSDQDEDAEGWVRRFRDGAGFADLIRAVKDYLGQKLAGDTPRAFLLYIDQGEEIYASTEREGKPDIAAKRDAEAFSRVIAEAAGRADCRILFSLRSDYYGSLQDDNALFAVTRGVDVPPMPVEALRQAIERPATALGVRFEPPAMPGYLAGATAREAGALPLLAYLLSDMWREMQAREDGLHALWRTVRNLRCQRGAARARRALSGTEQAAGRRSQTLVHAAPSPSTSPWRCHQAPGAPGRMQRPRVGHRGGACKGGLAACDAGRRQWRDHGRSGS